jgi:hypothetical protein
MKYKTPVRLLVNLLMSATVLAADRPWQRINLPSLAEVASTFRTPSPEYGMILWWGWDGPVTEAVIIRDLDFIQSRGFSCVMIEAGYGMSAPYLSPGWFQLIRIAVEQARQRGMRVWVEDEGKYPSGFAGGKFSTERPDLRMQGLVVAERIDAVPGQALSSQLPPETVGALAVNLEDKSSHPLDIHSGELRWTAPEGKWQIWLIQHQFRTSDTRSVNNPTRGKDKANSLCDYLNPDATRQFLVWTHEQYRQAVGSEFGRTFLGFMGDEPDFAYTPWTPKLPEEFERRKGYDVRPYLASFFAPSLTDEARRAKADYWDVWSDLFRENFFRVQAEWCANHNLEYLVHLNHEDMMPALVKSEGDYFKDMRYVQVPGIDTIWNQIWPGTVADFPKLASSAAHLFGRPRAFSESFAAYKIRPNIQQARWVMDYQFVRGINLQQIMFLPASANRPATDSTPSPGAAVSATARRDSFFTSDEFVPIAQYVNRATYLLSQGTPAARIALYHPTSSMWLGDDGANRSALALAQQLLEHQCDFDFVDEQALSSILLLERGAFKNLSGQAYAAVIIPSVSSISKSALDRLRAFAAEGGRVVFAGREPSLVVDKTFLKASGAPDLTWAVREPSGTLTPQVIEALPPPDVTLDQPCPAMKVLHRRWRDADLYFFFNESFEKQSRKAVLAGSGQVQIWDAFSGFTGIMASTPAQKGSLQLRLTLEPQETKFVIIGPPPSLAAAE